MDSSSQTTQDCWIQGRLGLLQIIHKHSTSLKKTNKMQKRVDRIEQAIATFFKELAGRIESIEGLDLTDRGDDAVGAGLCMLSASSVCSSSSDDEFLVNASQDEQAESDLDCPSGTSSSDEDATESSSSRKRKHAS
jgi:hypothetical protein